MYHKLLLSLFAVSVLLRHWEVCPHVFFHRHESPVQLGSPLLGTVVEVRDTNGSPVHEGTGQVFLGWFIFVGLFFRKKNQMFLLFISYFFYVECTFNLFIFTRYLVFIQIVSHAVSNNVET